MSPAGDSAPSHDVGADVDVDAEPIRRWGPLDRQAVVDTAPLVVSAIPFGLVAGIAIADANMPTGIAWLTSPLIFAGSAQITMVSLAGTVPMIAAIWALAVVNARHLMYSAALAGEFRRQPRWFRWLATAFIIDQNFALTVAMADQPAERVRRYYLTSTAMMYLVWLATTATGALVGGSIPTSWQLQFAVPVMFLGLTVGVVKSRPQFVAAAVGAGVGLACAGLPDRLGVVIGAVAGVLAGLFADRVWRR